MSERLYLDHNATTFTWPDVQAAVHDAMNCDGNPSAQHDDARRAAKWVEDARRDLGLAMGVCAQDIIFTGSGTEADNTAIWSAFKSGCKRALISSMDHPATLLAAENFGMALEPIPANLHGQTDMDWLEQRLAKWDSADGRPFVSVVAANSESGVIQDTERAIELTQKAGGLILIDAVQALGKLPMNFIGADYISVSAHKIGGPKGVGALYAAPDAPFAPLLAGGGQERRRRAGTLNVAGIAGFGVAAKQLINLEHTRELRDILETELKMAEPDIVIFGEDVPRLPNTSFFAVPDASSMTLMMQLDLACISVSTGTACSSGKALASRAITAMGRGDEAPKGAIRVSFGDNNTLDDVHRFIGAWRKIRKRERKAA